MLEQLDSNTGIVICGHGSRSKLAIEEFADLVKAIKFKLPHVPIEYGYLEFANPTISEALDKLQSFSIQNVIAIPAMLFAAGHTKNDIPSLLKSYSEKNGLNISYGRELGINSSMIGAAGGRIQELINNQQNKADYAASEILLVVVGRGSSDPDANSNVSKITRMLVEGFGFGWGETVFSGVTFPLVEPGLRKAIQLGYKRIVVFPYFLFSGLLINRIKEHTLKVSSDFPEVEFLFSDYLGSHPLVVDTFLERIQEVLLGRNTMNCSLCKYRSTLLGFENEVGLVQHSHHHHVEAVPSNAQIPQQQEHHHSHSHFPYPHSDHPLGPVTLSSLNDPEI